jgi:hypothetical protein
MPNLPPISSSQLPYPPLDSLCFVGLLPKRKSNKRHWPREDYSILNCFLHTRWNKSINMSMTTLHLSFLHIVSKKNMPFTFILKYILSQKILPSKQLSGRQMLQTEVLGEMWRAVCRKMRADCAGKEKKLNSMVQPLAEEASLSFKLRICLKTLSFPSQTVQSQCYELHF